MRTGVGRGSDDWQVLSAFLPPFFGVVLEVTFMSSRLCKRWAYAAIWLGSCDESTTALRNRLVRASVS